MVTVLARLALWLALASIWPQLLLSHAQSNSSVLVDFQVAQPPPLPAGAKQCTHLLMSRTFANSFGNPEILDYVPPTDCGTPGTWAAVSLNFTATSNGTQFDRLSSLTFHNVEIWRTSTPEPTVNGIIWTFIKDSTKFLPLWAKPGRMILDLDNLLSDSLGLNGNYTVLLSATFFESSAAHPPARSSDLIVPLSNLQSNAANHFSVPPDGNTSVSLPPNTIRAIAELFASGNGNEEFWYFNVPDASLNDFPSGFTFGKGAFREVRLLVDGQVAGVAFPYPVIFTGGINPAAWRPITSYGALDQPTYFVDLSPFIPILNDGKNHTVAIDVASAEDDGSINNNWFVSGNIQVFLDPSGKRTTGSITKLDAPPLASKSVNTVVGANGDVNVTITTSRSINIEADLVSGSGARTHVAWSQSLTYSNVQNYADDFNVQNMTQTSSGSMQSLHNGAVVVADQFSFPLDIDLTGILNGTGFTSLFDHSLVRTTTSSPIFPTVDINSHQTSNGTLIELPTGHVTGNATTNNNFSYRDSLGNTFTRVVSATDNVITTDRVGGSLAGQQPQLVGLQHTGASGFVGRLIRGQKVVSASP